MSHLQDRLKLDLNNLQLDSTRIYRK